MILTAGNRHESTQFTALLDGVDVPQNHGRSRKRFAAIAADKGYSGYRNRRAVRERGMQSIIPQKSNEKARRGRAFEFDRELYRRRNVIERSIGWLKELRRIATRYEKLATSYLSMLKMAFILRYFNTLDLRDVAIRFSCRCPCVQQHG